MSRKSAVKVRGVSAGAVRVGWSDMIGQLFDKANALPDWHGAFFPKSKKCPTNSSTIRTLRAAHRHDHGSRAVRSQRFSLRRLCAG